MSDAEVEDMERDDAASSSGDGGSEGGSSDADGQSDDGGEDSSSEEEIEPRVLPNRTTRSSKMGNLVQEDEADQEFWTQDFFQEEERDDEWETSESESEDEPDTDFDQSEDDGDDEEKDGEPKEHRAKRLAPPGAKKKARQAARGAGASPRGGPSERQSRRSAPAAVAMEADAPTLRASTRARVEVAEAERARQEAAQAEMMAKRRSKSMNAPEVKPLTQEELLAEAAKTELENQRSLQLLLAREEEVKRRNAVTATKYVGPIVRYHSKCFGKDTEQMRLELINMREAPPSLQPQRAPPHPEQPVCRVSGLPAKYRHPLTGMPYATREAYAQIERHAGGAHAAAPAAGRQRYDGTAGSEHPLSSALPDAKRRREQGDFAAATAEWQQQQSGGLQAAHMHMAGGQPGVYMDDLAAY